MFQVNKVYRHRNCLDLDIYVLRIPYRDEKKTFMKIHWVYRNGTLCVSDKITVKNIDFKNWSIVN